MDLENKYDSIGREVVLQVEFSLYKSKTRVKSSFFSIASSVRRGWVMSP